VIVLKFGGELVEEPSRLNEVVSAVTAIARKARLAIVHGGGKEIDAALNVAGLQKRQVDGLRITDAETLDVVVRVLAGTVNTRLVAALATARVAAVGLTGADGGCGLADPAAPHRTVDGRDVDLGRVGIPRADANPRVISLLCEAGFVPVIASIGLGADGGLFNVNADVFAAHLAAKLGAHRLVVAGTTAGVLDEHGQTLQELDRTAVNRLISARTATAGMIAKLRACDRALSDGVGEVVIVDGRDGKDLVAAALEGPPARSTRLVATAGTRA
jgi:acetylglutamate kinase